MKINIQKGEEFNYFKQEAIDSFYSVITKNITKYIKDHKNIKNEFLGCFVLKDIEMIGGEKINVFIEYNAFRLPGGIIDAGVHKCIIYDDIPDEVLDRINEVNSLINNSL